MGNTFTANPRKWPFVELRERKWWNPLRYILGKRCLKQIKMSRAYGTWKGDELTIEFIKSNH